MRLTSLGLLLFLHVAPAVSRASDATAPTDYDVELQQIDESIRAIRGGDKGMPSDPGRATGYVHLLFRRAWITGDLTELAAVGTAIDDVLKRHEDFEDLHLLKAHLHFKFHRLSGVKEELARVVELANSPHCRALKADLDFQEGRYGEAGKGYEDLARKHPTWDNLARLAYLRAKMGDPDAADRLYAEAGETLTAKEMRSFAWIELQRGLLAFGRGRYDDASAHYDRAGRAYSGYWLVDEHKAELLAASGKSGEAVALYEKVLNRAPRPELSQSLGDLYLYLSKPDLAKPWHARAVAAYLESANRGDVHYYHHLAAYFADVVEDGEQAERWAREDLKLRKNHATREALAWSLFRGGRFKEAAEVVDQAMATGVIDAHLDYHAAMIYLAVGRADEGKKLLGKLAAMNPRYADFHVHR